MDNKITPETYDKTAAYEAEIKPLVTQLLEACQRHQLPCLFVLQVEQTKETGTTSITSDLVSQSRCMTRLVGLRYLAQNDDVLEAIMDGIKQAMAEGKTTEAKSPHETMLENLHKDAGEHFENQ